MGCASQPVIMRILRQFTHGLLLMIACAADGQSATPQESLEGRASLCVTEGSIEEESARRMTVSGPKMRAYLNRYSSDEAELRFTYLGATATQAGLGSGGSRQQFGLKLRAEDACNVVYVMWRLEPKSALAVSVKSNSGQHSSAECGNRGYQNIKPRFRAAIPALMPGQSHRLRADIRGQQLRAFVDGTLVWEGTLGAAAAALQGPIGLRTDNAHLEFELAVETPPGAVPHFVMSCRTRPHELD